MSGLTMLPASDAAGSGLVLSEPRLLCSGGVESGSFFILNTMLIAAGRQL
jgi:hypothetical protein